MRLENEKQVRKYPLPVRPQRFVAKSVLIALALFALFAGLYTLSRSNYPLFHSLVDGATVFIAASVFIVVWIRRHNLDNYFYLFIGIAFVFFAFLDFLHLLGNKDMGVFPGYGNIGPALYIASRYILSISFLVAPLFIRRKFNAGLVIAGYSLVTLLLVLSILYWKNFPMAYIEGVGLTPFKIISDYMICGILLGAAVLLWYKRQLFDPKVLKLVIFSLILFIATGLAFTLYTDPFGVTNAVGHFFQIGSFYLVYRALIETVITKPQDILYRNLRQNQEIIKVNHDRLKVISEANSLLLSSGNPETIAQAIGTLVMDYLKCDCFLNYIVDENVGRLRLNAYAGIPPETANNIRWLDYGAAVGGAAARDGRRIVCEDIQAGCDLRSELLRSWGLRAYACFPLQLGAKTVGTLSFGTRTRLRFTEGELNLMKTIAGQFSIAMERKLNEEHLRHYARELESANKELESFSYSVSHDLRAPLRTLDGFSLALLDDYSDKLDETGKDYLNRISRASQTMSQLVDDILKLSRISRAEMSYDTVDLSGLVKTITDELKASQPERQVEFVIAPGLTAKGDANLLQISLRNLLDNAWKYTGKCSAARIEFGSLDRQGEKIYFVRDNGAGFDMQYQDKLFQPFQRLHSEKAYSGTGIGLATVQRVIRRHNGRIWAESEPDKGSVFYFTLG